MKTILIHLPEDWLVSLDDLASQWEVSRAEAIRSILGVGLELEGYEVSEPVGKGKYSREKNDE